jgi:hypothetical protein
MVVRSVGIAMSFGVCKIGLMRHIKYAGKYDINTYYLLYQLISTQVIPIFKLLYLQR